MQEMKRRYASIYIPDETIDDQFNEHCGVCDEQGIEEAVLADRDYKYDGKVIKISRKNFSKVPNDYKNSTKGKERMITYDDKAGTVSVPVEFTEEVEVSEGIRDFKLGDAVKFVNDDSDFLGQTGKITSLSGNGISQKATVKLDKGGKSVTNVLVKVDLIKEEVAEGWKKGKYTIKDENGKILGTYSSGGKAKKVMDDLMQKGDYPELTVSMVEEVEVDESNELQAIMALDDVGIEASINKKDQVVVKKKDLKKAEAALKKSFRKGGAPELHAEEVEIEEKIEKESYGSFITAAAKAKKEGKKTFMMGGKKYPVTIKQKISAAYEEAEVEEAKLYAAKGTAYPATIDTLKMIVREKQNQTVMFKSGKSIVDLFTASAMVQVYDALKKPEMKKTFEKMIGDKAGFLKTQAFAMKMISGGK